jgi:hypothetical protein
MRNALVKSTANDISAILKNIYAAEVMPQAKRNRG